MKILLVSDIHANLPALQAVLDGAGFFSGLVCLGDTTGYGPDAASCLAELRNLEKTLEFSAILSGNHDALLSGHLSSSWFNPHALRGVKDTARTLDQDAKRWVSGLPSSKKIFPEVYASHGSPLEPLTGYLWGGIETAEVFKWMEAEKLTLCFCGHTHEAAVFSDYLPPGVLHPVPGRVVKADGERKIVNPGSVGFPRSFNGLTEVPALESWPAYYALWDTESQEVEFREAVYDRRGVESRMP